MTNLLQWLNNLILLIVCIGFISTLLIIFSVKMSSRDRFSKVLKGLVIGSIVFVLLQSFVISRILLYSFYNQLKNKASIDLRYTGNVITINSRGELTTFLNIIKRSERISAHHSHPINEIQLTLPDDESVYTISRDSSNENEYWLVVQTGGVERILLQFKTSELNKWLDRNGIRY